MITRPVSIIDPRFKQVPPDWWGKPIYRGPQPVLDLPPEVGMWDPKLQQVVYPGLVEPIQPKKRRRRIRT